MLSHSSHTEPAYAETKSTRSVFVCVCDHVCVGLCRYFRCHFVSASRIALPQTFCCFGSVLLDAEQTLSSQCPSPPNHPHPRTLAKTISTFTQSHRMIVCDVCLHVAYHNQTHVRRLLVVYSSVWVRMQFVCLMWGKETGLQRAKDENAPQ